MGGASLPLLDEAGKNGGGAARPPGHRAKRWAGVAGVACLAVGCIVVTAFSGQDVGARAGGSARGQELLQQDLILFKMEPPPEPWDPPSNLYMYWGGAQNKRFGHSGDNLRHLMRLGRLQGGEYRDPHFIFNFESESFRDLAEECCSTMLMAPMKNSMPVWVASSAQAQRIRNYVSNGNHMIFTGGSLVSLEFINRYFYYNIQPLTSEVLGASSKGFGNYSPGPWRKFKTPYLPKIYERTPDVLRQYRTEVTALALDSLPSGTNILYMDRRSTPAFQLLFCQRLSALHGEAPVKTLPGECPMYAKKGYPCSCGTITYIGYDWHYDQEAESWDELMLAAVEYQADPGTSITLTPNCPEGLVPEDKDQADPHAPKPPPVCKEGKQGDVKAKGAAAKNKQETGGKQKKTGGKQK